MNSNGKNLELPRSIFRKMRHLQQHYISVYDYLNKAVNRSLKENLLALQLFQEEIDKFKFDLINEDITGRTLTFTVFVQTQKNFVPLFKDGSSNIKTRMQGFYHFESDLEFVLTFLYFIAKNLQIPFTLVSDTLFEQKIKTTSLDLTEASDRQILKTIELSLCSH